MDKLNYLFKTFSRTKRKDNENYVINALWNKINNLNLKPVSQQYVITNNKHFFLDLYFPSINVAIEIDEIGHKKNKIADEKRSKSIKLALNEKEFKQVVIYRIKTYETTIQRLNEEINNIVQKITDKIKTNDVYWQTSEEEIELIKKKGNLSIADNYTFRTINEILNGLFELNINPKSIRKASYDLPQLNQLIWFPKRSYIQKNKEIDYQGWINRLSHNGKMIIEVNKDPKNMHFQKIDNKIRIVFMKYKDSLGEKAYRFLGMFKEKGIKKINANGVNLISKNYTLHKDSINLEDYKIKS